MHHIFLDILKERNDAYEYAFAKRPTLLSVKQIKKQNALIIGYIRQEAKCTNQEAKCINQEAKCINETNIIYFHDHIAKLILLYARFHDNAYTDPANRISNKDIKNSNVYRLKGNNLFKNKQYEASIIKYNTALKFNPNDHRIYCNKSLCNLLLNNLTASREDAWYAVKLCPTDAKCWCKLCAVAEKVNDFTTAYLAYRTAHNMFEIIAEYDKQITNPYSSKFTALTTKINSHQHRNDKLWVKYFDKHEFEKTSRLKFNYCLKISKFSKQDLLDKMRESWKYYFSTFTTLFELIHKSKAIKYIMYKSPIVDIRQPKDNRSWCVTYTTWNRIENNKRLFNLQIICSETKIFESIYPRYGVPNAKTVISELLKTMVRPCLHFQPYKPYNVLIANRLREEFIEIMSVMKCYGIRCELETREHAIHFSTMCHTHVDGYNYFKTKKEYIQRKEYCTNVKCTMTRTRLWKTKGKKFKICSGCKKINYCSRKCQKYDWKHDHNSRCTALKMAYTE
eukprot:487464_1